MAGDRGRVLVIDDDGLLRAMLGMILHHQGYTARTAASAWDGLMTAIAWNPSLIVVDMALPVMNGLEFIQALRQRPQLAAVPVLLVSGHPAPEFAGTGRVAFLAKPFEPAVFNRCIRELLAPATLQVATG